jgi:hypothetical protein
MLELDTGSALHSINVFHITQVVFIPVKNTIRLELLNGSSFIIDEQTKADYLRYIAQIAEEKNKIMTKHQY